MLALFACSFGAGCFGEGPSDPDQPARAQHILAGETTVSNDGVLGFESPLNWSTTTAGALLGQSTTHGQGSYSLSVRPSNTNGYTPIASTPLTTLSSVGPTLAVDLLLPQVQPNPNWYGTFQIYLNCPSRSINSQFLAQVELTGKPRNAWVTLQFPVSAGLLAKLLQTGYSDLVITAVLNVPVPTTGSYLLDNLRFLPAANNGCNGLPNGTPCNDNNACTLGDICQSNSCKAGAPRVCQAADQCHSPGTCAPSTGVCSNPTKPNGAVCDDGNLCTQRDTCQSGLCKGSGSCGPTFTATPSTLDFGALSLNGTSGRELTVTNTGTAAGIPVLTVAGSNATEFAVLGISSEVNPCTATTSLAPGASCHAFAQFIPLSPGSKSAIIKAGDATIVTLSGVALPGGTFTADPGVVNWGTLPINAAGSRQITVTNTSTMTDTPIFSLTGANTADFSWDLLESDPQSCSKPIAPGGTCIMLALLQPLTSGYKAAYLQIGNFRAVNLLAEIAPGGTFTADPGVVNWGILPISAAGSRQITVTNTSTVTDTPIFSLTGATTADFSWDLLESDPQSCSKPIAPGGTCIMLALLQPLTSGYKAAYLQIGNSRAVNLLAEIAP